MDLVDDAQREIDSNLRLALARATAGDRTPSTGICIECECAIAPERLEALPHAQRCIDCQVHLEKSDGAMR